MKSIKKIWEENKVEIVMTSCIVGLGMWSITYKPPQPRKLLDITGKSAITWKPNGKFLNLEEIKRILDLNADNTVPFCVVKEPFAKDVYSFIRLTMVE